MNSDSRTVKGLNIAIIVLAVLGLLASLFLAFSVGVMSIALSDPSVQSSMYDELYYDYYYGSSYDSSLSPDEIVTMLVGLGALGVGYAFLSLVASIITLITGIMGVRNASNSDKLGTTFALTIVSLILNVVCFSFVTLILLIISAVFINKVRKSAVSIPYAANAAAPGVYQQQVYAQPAQQMPQQPVAPSPTYQQPQPPVQPVAAQPTSPAQPTAAQLTQQPPVQPTADQPAPPVPPATPTASEQTGEQTQNQPSEPEK